MATYRLTLEYDGSGYSGWQRQPERATVEGALRAALSELQSSEPELTAASRTDAGAHAHGQVVGLAMERDWVPERLLHALNSHLPDDVVVTQASHTDPSFDARRDARSRTYRYVVVPRQRRSPLTRHHAWFVHGDLDIAAMRRAAEQLVGSHDFAAFGRATRPGGPTVRRVASIRIRRQPMHTASQSELDTIIIEVAANAFLHGMMRSIAGALVAVGRHRLSGDAVGAMLSDPQREHHHVTVAPAHGLHQWTVTYA